MGGQMLLDEPWPRSGRLLRHLLFFPSYAAQPNRRERVSRLRSAAEHDRREPGLDAGATGDYIAWLSKEEKTPQQPAAACGCQGSGTEQAAPHGVPRAIRPGAVAAHEARAAQYTARIKDRSTYHGAQRPAGGGAP